MNTLTSKFSLFASVAMEAPDKPKGAHKDSAPQGNAPVAPEASSVTVTIAGIDVALPNKFNAGHILSEAEAKVIDAAYRRQFANNQNAAFAAFEKKAKDWDASTAADKGARPVNPCSDSAMLEAYKAYVPQVGASQQTALEKARLEAGLRALHEMMSEHNALIDAGKPGFMGPKHVALKKGKGAAEARDGLIAKVLASTKQAERVQRHLDAVLAERGAAKSEPEAQELDASAIDFE